MEILTIAIERRGSGSPCGTLVYQREGRRASMLWLLQWRRGQQVTVEFVPGEGGSREDVRAHHDQLVNAVTAAAFEHVSRKSLFT